MKAKGKKQLPKKRPIPWASGPTALQFLAQTERLRKLLGNQLAEAWFTRATAVLKSIDPFEGNLRRNNDLVEQTIWWRREEHKGMTISQAFAKAGLLESGGCLLYWYETNGHQEKLRQQSNDRVKKLRGKSGDAAAAGGGGVAPVIPIRKEREPA
jgi:hypothetical protein